jgi:hypothetical protein
MPANLSQKTEKKPSARREQSFRAFDAILGANAQPKGTKFSAPHFCYETATRRSPRRLSRIAKGPFDPLFKNERSRG